MYVCRLGYGRLVPSPPLQSPRNFTADQLPLFDEKLYMFFISSTDHVNQRIQVKNEFANYSSGSSSSSEQQFFTSRKTNAKTIIGSLMENTKRGFQKGSEEIKTWKKPVSHPQSDHQTKEAALRSRILDPQGQFVQFWNKIFVLSCVIAVSLDPLFFYIPVIDGTRKCLGLDTKLEITACVLRSITDMFYVLHIIFQFRAGFISPSSRVFGRGELIDDPYAIARRYLSSYFIIDILAVLPLPQLVVLVIIPHVNGPISLTTKDLLKFVIFAQYVPRFLRIIPLYKEVTRTSGIFTETAWVGAAFNLLLYMLASHLVGAFWYLFTIEREDRCWRYACARNNRSSEFLYCGEIRQEDFSFLNTSCPLLESSAITDPTQFDFGIFLDALRSRVVEEKKFTRKFFYCFWWGLRNLSSLGQNLQTSTFVWEILFAIFVAILGLLLFSLLIGNMQKYLESITVKVEEMRVKRRDAERWMSHRMLPENLRERIRRYEQYKWQENRGVEEESLIRNLPKDLRRDIKRHLCLSFLTSVPVLGTMDDQLLDAMCDRLKPVLYAKNSYIVREGDPVEEMLFVMRGELLTATTNGGRTDFLNSVYLKAGDFCGEELLTWALDPNSSSSLPLSTRTVEAVLDVEAFALMPDDLKFVSAQFRRLHSKQLQHAFRFYSQQWRTWAAGCIQVVWRRHCHRKLDQSLREEEDRLKYRVATAEGDASTPSLAGTIYASKFAANALRARRNHVPSPKLSPRLPPLLPQKPAEPDFSSGNRK